MTFKNRYFALRHGESMPNIRGIILSGLEEGMKDAHTLTERGEQQVAESAKQAKQAKQIGLLDAAAIIYSSPFSRAKRTAEIARNVLGAMHEIVFDERLRERWFGDWEGKDNSHYQNVWDKDVIDAAHKEANVESVEEVIARVTDLISDLERQYDGKNIVLVSHGDALQILQTFFAGTSPALHRSLEHLKTAEVRALN